MTNPLLLACGAAAALTSATFAGPLHKAWVAPDAAWIVHVDMDAMRSSTLGSFVTEHRKDLELEGLDEFKKEVGIDPLADIKGVTVYGSSPTPGECVAIVTATSAIDTALAKLGEKERGLKTISEGAYTLYTWTEHGTERFGYVRPGEKPDERIVIAAVEKPRLLEAIKRLEAPGEAPAQGAIMATPKAGSVLFVSATAMKGLPDTSMMLQKVQGLRFDCGEASGEVFAELHITAGSSEDATNLLQAAQGGLAIARMCAGSDPDLKDLVKASEKLKLSSDEKTVKASLRCSSSDLKDLLGSALQAEKAEKKTPPKGEGAPAATPKPKKKKTPEPM
jgi:hypothetical protein